MIRVLFWKIQTLKKQFNIRYKISSSNKSMDTIKNILLNYEFIYEIESTVIKRVNKSNEDN